LCNLLLMQLILVPLLAHSELGGIWEVEKKIWQQDFPGIYTSISAYQWSETIQPIMEAVRIITPLTASCLVNLLIYTFTFIEQGWQGDSATLMVMHKKQDSKSLSLITNEQQLARLTDYVAFLEN
uniref:CSN8/PSMD8/EIF3K domain-containing protein n=1 Tax=Xenopus tropicalis TaxID=8364 RepID=A0A6I8SJU9_XENTR